jgi:hypothetical protein
MRGSSPGAILAPPAPPPALDELGDPYEFVRDVHRRLIGGDEGDGDSPPGLEHLLQ